MNRVLLSTSLALALSGGLAFAQQQDPAPAPAAKHHHTHNPQRQAAKISKKLNLSSDQTAKLEPILADRNNKIAALRNDTTISPVVMKQQMKAIHQQTRTAARHHPHTRPAPATPQHASRSRPATTVSPHHASSWKLAGPSPRSPRQTRGTSSSPPRTCSATHFHAKSP